MLKLTIPDSVKQISLCGGLYNNFASLESYFENTKEIEYKFCLGDIGGFGPLPNRTLDMVKNSKMICIQGNYDDSVGNGLVDCGCGYIDKRDRHFAQVSFDYTFKNTSESHKKWLSQLPKEMIIHWQGKKIMLCHGSPDNVNEFVWESETTDQKIEEWLSQFDVDIICCTHSGIPWIRKVRNGLWMNVGVLGRPAHDGTDRVYYSKVTWDDITKKLNPELIQLKYNLKEIIQEMKNENLPIEFIESLTMGKWTTCFNILPKKELVVQKRI